MATQVQAEAAQAMPAQTEPARPGILAVAESELAHRLKEWGCAAFRARQIRTWILQRRADRFSDMSDLPKDLRRRLEGAFVPLETQVVHQSTSRDGTVKLLLGLARGGHVECVLLREQDRHTACLSTQVGCAMGCAFCASGLKGLERNLHSHEIVEQALHLQRRLPAGRRLTHVVVMGMGEPLANLDHLLPALDLLRSPRGLGVSARHITISTVGLVAPIRRLARTGVPYSLAISLHAPDDALRRRLIPSAGPRSIRRLVQAARDYQAATGRQVTFEYLLLAGVNDRIEQARQLAQVLGRGQFVNLIAFNPVAELPWRRPASAAVRAFAQALRRQGLVVKTRKRKGSSIQAACGQLRLRAQEPASAPDGETPISGRGCIEQVAPL